MMMMDLQVIRILSFRFSLEEKVMLNEDKAMFT
jgi:hypothetical protein